MAEVASAYVSLIPSARGFAAGIQKETSKAADSAGRDAGKRFGLGFKSIIAGVGGLAAGGAVVDFLKDSVGGASDLNETLSKSRVIFGGNAKAIDEWAKSADDALGLSRQAALESAASFGDMFSQIGIGADRSAKMSKSVVQLAADLGSFNNLGTDDVLERIAGGFRGEYDALQKVIPNISAARVQEEALRRTHKKAAKDLTATEKAEATLAIIRKDGARAAGDFERTSGGLANQQKILKARTDNLKAAIGEGLLPVTTEIVSKTSDFVQGMQDGTGAGGEFVDVLTDARDIGRGVLDFFNSIPGPVKKYGAELLIAAVALNKINNGLTAGRSRMTAWLDTLGPAEAKMTRTAKASYALGVGLRNLAGAGGMIAIAKGSQESNEALGALEITAGAAAAGFAVGGPWGAAIGGAVGGLTALYKAANKGTESAKVSIPSWREYAQTLSGVSEATTKATRDMAFQRLESSGLLKATRELGLTDREAVNAMLGNRDARLKLAQAMRSQNTITKEQKAALEKETGAVGASRLAQLQHNVAIAANREELKKARKALQEFMNTPASKRVSITGVEGAVAQLSDLSRGLREALGLTRDLNTAGPGGIDILLNPQRRATGGPVRAGEPYIVGERRAELFVPDRNGRIVPKVPTSVARSTSSNIDAEQASFRGFSRALAANNVVIMPKSSLDELDLLVGAL